MAVSEQDKQQIAAVIEQYRRGFATVDVEDLKAIWDQDYDNIIYIPQELAQPVRGWARVEQYYKSVAESLERDRTMTVSDLSVDVFGDVAYAFCIFHFEGEVKGQSQPRIADGRDTFILRRKSGTWKVIHYHESRPGPVSMTEEGKHQFLKGGIKCRQLMKTNFSQCWLSLKSIHHSSRHFLMRSKHEFPSVFNPLWNRIPHC